MFLLLKNSKWYILVLKEEDPGTQQAPGAHTVFLAVDLADPCVRSDGT